MEGGGKAMSEPKTIADELFRQIQLEDQTFTKVCTILGVDVEKCNSEGFVWPCGDVFFDYYDYSIEVVRDIAQTPMTKEQANAIFDMGFAIIFETIGETGLYRVRNAEPQPCRATGGSDQTKKLRAALAEKDKRIAELEEWKTSAMKVIPNYQELGRVMELQLGSSVSEQLLPWIVKTKERLASLQALMEQVDHRWPSYCHYGLQSQCPRCLYEKWLKEGA